MGPKTAKSPFTFTKGTGPVLSNVQIHLIFWGTAWTTEVNKKLMADVRSAAEIMVQPGEGGYLSQLREYNGDKLIDVNLDSPITLTDGDPTAPFADDNVTNRVCKYLAENEKTLDNQREQLFMVVLPAGIMPKSDPAVDPRAGKHDSFTCDKYPGKSLYYAWITTTKVGSPLPRITVVLSEELVETITDPKLGDGWVNEHGQELCDVCEGINQRLKNPGGKSVLVRTYYSNKLGDCFPPLNDSVEPG